MIRSSSLVFRAMPFRRGYLHTALVSSTTTSNADDDSSVLASLQRANSSNPAVSYLVAHYEATRDGAVQSALHKIDQFLVQHSNHQNSAALPAFSRALVNDFYNSLQPVPWLQFHSPFILNDAVPFYLNPVAHSTQMSQLGLYADQVAGELDVLNLAIVLHSLLLLGLPKSHRIVRRFFDRIGNFPPGDGSDDDNRLLLFGEIGKISRLLGSRGGDEMRAAIAALSQTVRNKTSGKNKPDLAGITALLGLVNSRMPLSVHDEMAIGKLALGFLKETSGNQPLSSRFFSLLFAWLSEYRGPTLASIYDSAGVSRRYLLDLVYAGLSPLAKSLTDVEIAEVVSELKRGHCYPGRLRVELGARALLLCSGSFGRPLDIRLLSNSFYALDNTCDPHLIRFFTDKFADHLDNADVLLVSNIAENLQYVQRSISVEFRDLFLSHVERLAPGIVSHMTRLTRVLQFLDTIPPHDVPPSFNTRFCSELVIQLGRSETRRLANQMIYPYLISHFAHNIPDALYDRLLSILSQFNLAALEKLLQAIRTAPVSVQNTQTQKSHKLRIVRSAVYRRVSEMVESKALSADETKALSASQLFRTARILLKGASSSSTSTPLPAKDIISLRQSFASVMETLARTLDSISPTHTYQLSDLILNGVYYNEALLQRLEEFVTREASTNPIELPLLLSLVRCMATVGYEPIDSLLFGKIVSNVVLAALDKQEAFSGASDNERSAVLSTLRIAKALTTMRCYPQQLFERIFSPGFLELVDRLLAETKLPSPFSKKPRGGETLTTLHDHIRETLMRLNRAVVLECTEMQPIIDQIPWFHAHYRPTIIQYPSRDNFKQEISDAIERLVASRSDYFLLCDQLTPFFHFIDFELMPVDPEPDSSTIGSPGDKQVPIAIIILSPRQFVHSSNGTSSDRLRGSVKQVIRQLEILGYRVVTLSPSDFQDKSGKDSSLTDASKERYIHQSLSRLLFGDKN